MAEICINERWKIGADSKQWIVYEKFENTWRAVRFYVNLEYLASDLMELSLRHSEAQAIEVLADEVKRFKQWLLASHFLEKAQKLKNGNE